MKGHNGTATARRVDKVREQMAASGLGAFLTLSASNRRYLTGFTGSAGAALVLPARAVLLVDFRYTQQAQAQAPGWEVREVDAFPDAIAQVLQEAGVSRAGFEAAHVTYAVWESLQEKAGSVQWVPTKDVVESVRAIKDPQELDAIRRAVALGDRAFSYLLEKMRPGVSEQALAVELEGFLRREGAEGLAFPSIVASGPNGALPHARPGPRELQPGDLVVLDFGCVVDGYCSDMTRTVCLGEPDQRQRELYQLVLEAQKAGVAAIRPGVSGKEVDGAARRIIEEAGYGPYFGHGLGHGVGLEVHEALPRLNRKAEVALAPGMVTSVEPGIYLPGWGGIRIEDLVVVTPEGAEILTQSPKELIALPI